MNKLTLDAAWRAKLAAPVELTDEAGQTIGFVISPQQYARIEQLEEDRRALYAWANSLVTDEELDAAEAEGGEYTPEEVKRYLESLADPSEQAAPADPLIAPARPLPPPP